MAKEKISFEKAFKELEHISNKIQNDEVNLDQLASLIQRAKELVKICQDQLRNIEKDVADAFEEE